MSCLFSLHNFWLLVLLPKLIKINFCLYQQNKSSESTVKFRQASNCYKKVLEATKLAYANKTKESTTSQKLVSWDFWQTANIVLNKGYTSSSQWP